MENIIFVKDLSAELGMDRSHLHKLIKQLKIKVIPSRDAGTGYQMANAISDGDAEIIRKHRKSKGYTDGVIATGQESYLYAVIPDPEARPDRVKVGKAASVDARVADYRTVCPDLEIARRWAAPATCEGYLIALADSFGVRVGPEIFDMNGNLADFLAAADDALKIFGDTE
jgi:biotin operon repressor